MKAKFTSSILLLLLFINVVSAQQAAPQPAPAPKISFISVTLGSAIPMSDYALADINSKVAGFAQSGFNFGINLNALFKESNVGIAVMFNSFSNPVDIATLKSQYEQTIPGTTWNVVTTDWKCRSFLAGMCLGYPAGDFSLNMRFLIGVTSAKSPQIDAQATLNSTGASVKIHQESDSKSAFSFDGGLSFCYHLIKDVSIIAGADYFSTNPKFSYLAVGGSTAAAGEGSQPIRVISVTGGIALMF